MKAQTANYFIVIAEEGSMTKAAAKLYISQPSLSQYLKRLEAKLGVELFDHSTSPLKLTYAGERYYNHVIESQKREENMLKELHDIQHEKSGLIRLGVAVWRGACLLPEVYPEFHRHYPDIRLELTEGKSQFFLKELLDDKIDFAIANIPTDINFDKYSIEVIKHEPIYLAVPSSHSYVKTLMKQPLQQINGIPVAPISIINEMPLIMTKPGQNITLQLKSFFAAHHLTPTVPLETSNLTTAINLVEAGLGAVFVPAEGAHICKREGRVTYFTLNDPQHLMWDLAVIYKKDAYVSRISRLFIDFVKKTIY